jgi:hypothetical protein
MPHRLDARICDYQTLIGRKLACPTVPTFDAGVSDIFCCSRFVSQEISRGRKYAFNHYFQSVAAVGARGFHAYDQPLLHLYRKTKQLRPRRQLVRPLGAADAPEAF